MKLADTLRHLTRDKVAMPLIAAAILLALGAQGVILWQSYNDTWSFAVSSTENILKSITSNIQRNLSIIELSLVGLQDAATDKAVLALPPDLRNKVLFDRAAGAQFLGSMLVLDSAGNILFDSGSVNARSGNFADRDYFLAQKDEDIAIFLSDPFKSRLREGDPSIALSRRVSDGSGQFNGIAMAAIRLAFFKSLFEQISLSPHSVITLTKDNGILLLRSPSTDGAGNTGLDLSKSPILRRILDNNEQGFVYKSVIDQAQRYYIHRKITGFPLVLTIGLSTDDTMRDWWHQATITGLITLLFCGLIVLVVRALRVALRRSQDMEAELATLSLTDPLTGLPNRRAFDMALAEEAQRAARNKTPLAIAIIDADHFKRINDRHGHKVGDEVLVRLAAEIQRSVRRPGDFAARFGGEEFIVILPATNEDGALIVANHIRYNVARMKPSVSDPALRKVTVSIGMACAREDALADLKDVIHRADQALYEAKGAGRDRVMVQR